MENYKNYKISIRQDEDTENPLDWGSCGFLSTHGRITNRTIGDMDKSSDDFAGHDEIQEHFEKNGYIWVRMYLYDHSGWTVSSKPFGCRWDSGTAGYLYLDRKTAIRDFGGKTRLTKAIKAKAASFLEGMIETLDQYYTGDVWGFEILDEKGEHVDSCWGFYGQDECLNEAKALVDAEVEHKERQAVLNASKYAFADSYFRLSVLA